MKMILLKTYDKDIAMKHQNCFIQNLQKNGGIDDVYKQDIDYSI